MKHIRTYSVFESNSKQVSPDSMYGKIPFALIEALPAFQEILALGYVNTTTPLIYKRGGIRFEHPILGVFNNVWNKTSGIDHYQIYNYGTIRKTTNGAPAIIKEGTRELETILDYSDKLEELLQIMKKTIAKKYFGISKLVDLDRISKLPFEDYLLELSRIDALKFESIFINSTSGTKINFEKLVGVFNKMMEETPEKAMVILQDVWNKPEFRDLKKRINVPEKYEDDMDMLGDMKELGF
jgi:hypothetical protein